MAQDEENLEEFGLKGRECALWWLEETLGQSVEWTENDIRTNRKTSWRKTVGEIAGVVGVDIGNGEKARLHFRIVAERTPKFDIFLYPPKGFFIDQRTDQRYWVGPNKVEIRKLTLDAIRKAHRG